MPHFAGCTFVLRIDRSSTEGAPTLVGDIAFLAERHVHPIIVAPDPESARTFVRRMNRSTNTAVGLSGADAGLLPAVADPERGVGAVQTHILRTLTSAGYVPVVEPTALGVFGADVVLAADDVASRIGSATDAVRVLFFHESGGVVDPQTDAVIDELTPAEALALADAASSTLDADLRAAIRAAAHGVRAGVKAAQIVDGRIAHAAIVEIVTARHLGTQVTGSVYLGD